MLSRPTTTTAWATLLVLALTALLVAASPATNRHGHGHAHEHTSTTTSRRRRQIAIIGGGPSGTSASYWLSKAQEQLEATGRGSEGFDLHLYEKDERIGGRTKIVYPFDDKEHYEPVELGASIFADVNRNMVRLAKLFKFPATARLGESDATTGIWDGREFVLDDLSGNWWSSAKIFWRYGYSPITVNSVVNDLKASFAQLYDPKYLHETSTKSSSPSANHSGNLTTKSGFPWESIESLAEKLQFSEPAATQADTYFYGKGVSQLFIHEVIEAATRVNYAQNTDAIHGLGAGVSLAASGAAGVKGGNYRVFEEALKRSNAKVHLGPRGEVTGIVKFKNRAEAVAAGKLSPADDARDHNEPGPKWWVGTAAGGGGLYDAVFIGTPWHSSGITLMNTESVIPITKYVHLYVTLVATNASHPDPTYFGRGKGSTVPKTIMTTYEAVRKSQRHGGDDGGEDDGDNNNDGEVNKSQLNVVHSGLWHWWDDLTHLFSRTKQLPLFTSAAATPKLDFLSLNYISNLGPRRSENGPPSMSGKDDHLVKFFSLSELSDAKIASILGSNTIAWTHRQQWQSYPELVPTRTFPPIRPDQGLFYINALEPLVSTMETSTVASRNAVALLLEQWYGLQFVTGSECSFQTYDVDDDSREGWDGWGCNAA